MSTANNLCIYAPLPPVIYHYCKPDGCLKILESRNIWLSNSRLLNDTSDSAVLHEIVGMEIEELERNADSKMSARIKQFRAALKLYNQNDVYVASFSAVGDSLSQWRAYGDDGEGFSIGFAPGELGASAYVKPAPGGSVTLFAIDYDEQLPWSKFLAQILQNPTIPNSDPSNMAVLCDWMNLGAKAPAFSEEKEYRIAYRPISLVQPATTQRSAELRIDGALQTLQFRNTKYGLCPYFNYPFQSDSVRELILGPKNRSEINHVEMMLAKFGYSKVKVKRSNATYR